MKIAVYASGELRSFLNDDQMLPYFVDFLKHHGHEVKVFGHTWKHCDSKDRLRHPCIDNFVIEDQIEIQQWQLEDIMVRKIITDEIIENPTPLFSSNFNKFVETYTKNYGSIFGQVWSQIRCFECFYSDVHNFDVHIRWRWDNKFCENKFETEKSHLTIDRIKNLKFEDKPLLITTNFARLKGVPHSGGIHFGGYLPDDFFCLNNAAMNILMKSNIGDVLHKILKNRGHLNLTPTSHTLWYEYLTWVGSGDIIYEFGIPSVLTLVR